MQAYRISGGFGGESICYIVPEAVGFAIAVYHASCYMGHHHAHTTLCTGRSQTAKRNETGLCLETWKSPSQEEMIGWQI
jgi:hypothetical protein